jgi:transcriptional regulator with XRE-family HTH domain
MQHRNPLHAAIAVELARKGMSQRDLADCLRVPDTTLSDWLRGRHPQPRHLRARIEQSLGLPFGSLPVFP